MTNSKNLQVVQINLEAVSIDSTSIKAHPDGTGALKKNGEQSIGKSHGGWTAKIHLIAANARIALDFSFSPGQASDGPEGRKPLASWGERRPNEVHNY